MNGPTFRTRIAVLWVVLAVAASTSLLLYLVTPGALEELAAGEMEGEPLTDAVGLMFATLVAVPLVMAVTVMVTGARWSRWTSVVVSLLLVVFLTFAVGSHLANGDQNAHVAMAVVAWFLIWPLVAFGVLWLRAPASTVSVPDPERVRPPSDAGV
jgi:hypothetical protein